MYLRTPEGLVWVSEVPTYWQNWTGRQAYKYHIASVRRRKT